MTKEDTWKALREPVKKTCMNCKYCDERSAHYDAFVIFCDNCDAKGMGPGKLWKWAERND